MTMDLAELRINRTPVTPNSKCEGCVHYDGNAAAKGGACEVGTSPALCGNGTERKYGYAPLDELGPDEIDDLATPTLVGASGAMNEHGSIEQMVKMKRVVLGDEDTAIAQRIHGELQSIARKSIGYAQGEVNMFSGAEMAQQRYGQPNNMMLTVAKSLYDLHFAPRKQRKYNVTDVLAFLKSQGMDVSDEEMELCKSRFGPTRQIKVPTMAEAAEHIRTHNAATRAAGGEGSQHKAPPVPAGPLKPPRNRTPTDPMGVPVMAKSDKPVVKKAIHTDGKASADPFDKRR